MTASLDTPQASVALAGPRHRGGLAALLLVTAVWGTTFPTMKAMSTDLGAMEIIAVRFAVAMLVLWPFLRNLTRPELRWGLLMGAINFTASALQISGLALTSSNRNAFLTGLNVLLVPILASLLGQRLGWPVLVGAVLVVLGMTGLFYESAPWNTGDTLTLCSAFVYAVFVLTFEYCARAGQASGTASRPERLAAVQALTMAVCGGVGMTAIDPQAVQTLWSRLDGHLWPMVYLGLVASAGIVWLQAWGQARVRAVEAALLYGLEPVFASITAIWYLHEVLAGRALLGALLIVMGVMCSQWPTRAPGPSGALPQP